MPSDDVNIINALRMEKIKSNPMLAVKPPKQPSEMEVSIYTDDELQKLNERLRSTNLHMAYQIGINLGLRAGECYALRWSDIDLEAKTVKVYHQLQNYNKRWCFTTLKTQNSYRTIMFSDKFKEYLLAALEQRKLNMEVYGDLYKTNKVYDAINDKAVVIEDFVNVKPDGEMLNTNSHKVIARIAKSEFNIDFKYHNLRHTHATILLEGGVNTRYIQERLGHSKLEFTLRMYTHITRAMNDQAANLLNSRLNI